MAATLLSFWIRYLRTVAGLKVGLAMPGCWPFLLMSPKQPNMSSNLCSLSGQSMLFNPQLIECSACWLHAPLLFRNSILESRRLSMN